MPISSISGKNTLSVLLQGYCIYIQENSYRRYINTSFYQIRMYEVSPSILEARLLGSGNQILDAAVVGIPNQENGQARNTNNVYSLLF